MKKESRFEWIRTPAVFLFFGVIACTKILPNFVNLAWAYASAALLFLVCIFMICFAIIGKNPVAGVLRFVIFSVAISFGELLMLDVLKWAPWLIIVVFALLAAAFALSFKIHKDALLNKAYEDAYKHETSL
ncbi:MAG: hypothetical protein LBJ12_08930 [Oscillospiraceae bacterium]|jgi:hypothetical protein|nr:hypothetical protein [Oscillospiraceae bacterium]